MEKIRRRALKEFEESHDRLKGTAERLDALYSMHWKKLIDAKHPEMKEVETATLIGQRTQNEKAQETEHRLESELEHRLECHSECQRPKKEMVRNAIDRETLEQFGELYMKLKQEETAMSKVEMHHQDMMSEVNMLKAENQKLQREMLILRENTENVMTQKVQWTLDRQRLEAECERAQNDLKIIQKFGKCQNQQKLHDISEHSICEHDSSSQVIWNPGSVDGIQTETRKMSKIEQQRAELKVAQNSLEQEAAEMRNQWKAQREKLENDRVQFERQKEDIQTALQHKIDSESQKLNKQRIELKAERITLQNERLEVDRQKVAARKWSDRLDEMQILLEHEHLENERQKKEISRNATETQSEMKMECKTLKEEAQRLDLMQLRLERKNANHDDTVRKARATKIEMNEMRNSLKMERDKLEWDRMEFERQKEDIQSAFRTKMHSESLKLANEQKQIEEQREELKAERIRLNVERAKMALPSQRMNARSNEVIQFIQMNSIKKENQRLEQLEHDLGHKVVPSSLKQESGEMKGTLEAEREKLQNDRMESERQKKDTQRALQNKQIALRKTQRSSKRKTSRSSKRDTRRSPKTDTRRSPKTETRRSFKPRRVLQDWQVRDQELRNKMRTLNVVWRANHHDMVREAPTTKTEVNEMRNSLKMEREKMEWDRMEHERQKEDIQSALKNKMDSRSHLFPMSNFVTGENMTQLTLSNRV